MDVNQVKALLVELVSGGMCFFYFSKALFSHTLSHNTQREKKIFLASSFP